MAASEYGLSIVLDFQDNASAGMQSAASAFGSLSGSADKLTMGISSTANSILDMNTSVVGMSVMGSQLQNIGQGFLGTLTKVGSKVVNTGSTFENFKLTLDALYKSESRANSVVNDLFNYATRSPYEVEDLQSIIVTLKSQGLEAFEQMTNASDGFTQSTMDWIGDLQAFRPGVTATRWKMALQNFLSGTDNMSARMLRNILDVGDLSNYLGHDLGKTVEERMQSLMEIVQKTGMEGMQQRLSKTWSVTISNMEDAWSQFTYRLGFGNKNNNMYKSATQAAQNLLGAETALFTNNDFIEAVSESFYGLVNPIEKTTEMVLRMTPAFSKWVGQHPKVVKFATGMTALSGAALVTGGSMLKLSSGVLNWMVNIQRLGGITGIMGMLGNSITAMAYHLSGLGALGALGFAAWRTNALGIRDLLTSIGSQSKSLISGIVNDVGDGMTLVQSLNSRGLNVLTSGLSTLRKALSVLGEPFYAGINNVFQLFGKELPRFNKDSFSLTGILNNVGKSLNRHFGDTDALRAKYNGLLEVLGTVTSAFTVALASSTLLRGGLQLLSSGVHTITSNFGVLASTLTSPLGLLGMGIATMTAGYYNNFLGLQSVMTPVVEGIRGQIQKLRNSFAQKNSDGKNSILSAITDKIVQLNETAKTWRSRPILEGFANDTGLFSSAAIMGEGVSIGILLGNGIASGLMLFGNPLQKLMGAGMLTLFNNIGNIRGGMSSFTDQIINAKDLLLEMSTGYGPKSQALAEKFGLKDFAEGLVGAKNAIKSLGTEFLTTLTESNNLFGSWINKAFPNLDLSVNGILNSFGRLGKRFNEFSESDRGKRIITFLGGFTTALSTSAGAMGILTVAGGLLSRTFGSVGKTILMAGSSALFNPFTLGTAAIMAYQYNLGGIKEKLSGILSSEREVLHQAQLARDGLQDSYGMFGSRFDSESNEVPVNISKAVAVLEVWDRKSELIKSSWGGIKAGVKDTVGALSKLAGSLFNLDMSGNETLVEKLGGKLIEFGGFDALKSKLESTGQTFGKLASKGAIVAGIFGSLSALSRNLGINISPVNMGLSLMSSGFGLIKSGLATTFNGIVVGARLAASSVMGFGRSLVGLLGGLIQVNQIGGGALFRSITTSLGDVLAILRRNILDIITTLMTPVGQVFSNVGPRLNNLFSLLTQGYQDFANNISSLSRGIFESFVRDFRAGYDAGISILQGGLSVVGQLAATFQIAKLQTTLGLLKSFSTMFFQSFAGASKMVLGLTGIASGLAMVTSAALVFGTLTTSDWNELSEVLKGQDTLLGKVGAGYDWFRTKLVGTTEKVREFISSIDVSKVVGSVTDTIGALGESIADIVAGGSGFNGLADLGGRLITEFTTGIVNNSSNIFSTVDRVLKSVMTSIRTYAPSVGANIGTFIGDVFEFAGRNAGDFVETAFTIMESFMNGLLMNKDRIVTGALNIVDALCNGIKNHAPQIINAASEIVSAFMDGLQDRGGLIGDAANSIITPIMNGLEVNGDKLVGVARAVFGRLWNVIKATVAEGLADILDSLSAFAAVAAPIEGLVGALMMLVPGLEGVGMGLITSGLQGGLLAAGLKAGASSLHSIADEADKANQSMGNFNATLSGSKGSKWIPEADFSKFKQELSNAELQKMWANNEIVYTIHTNDDGTTSQAAHTVERIKNADGNYEFRIIATEEGASAESIVDGNVSYAESNPAAQKVVAEETDNGAKAVVDEAKAYADSNPITLKFNTEEDAAKKRTAEEIGKKEQEARNNYAQAHNNRVLADLYMDELPNKPWYSNIGNDSYNTMNSVIHSLFKENFGNGGSPASYYAANGAVRELQKHYADLGETLRNMPNDWIPTSGQVSSLRNLANIDFNKLITSDFDLTKQNFEVLQGYIDQVKGSLSNGEGIELGIKYREDGSLEVFEKLSDKDIMVNVTGNATEQISQVVQQINELSSGDKQIHFGVSNNGALEVLDETNNKIREITSTDKSITFRVNADGTGLDILKNGEVAKTITVNEVAGEKVDTGDDTKTITVNEQKGTSVFDWSTAGGDKKTVTVNEVQGSTVPVTDESKTVTVNEVQGEKIVVEDESANVNWENQYAGPIPNQSAGGTVKWTNDTSAVKTHFTATGTVKWSNSETKKAHGGSHVEGATLLNDQNVSDPRELLKFSNGTYGMFEGRNVHTVLPKNTTVYPAAKTKQMLADNAPDMKSRLKGVAPAVVASVPNQSLKSETPHVYDNSVSISEGAIQIHVAQGTSVDARNIAGEVMKRIERLNKRNAMARR